MPTANRDKLDIYVDTRLLAAADMPPLDAFLFLSRWAEHVEREKNALHTLCHEDGEIPAHLVGLTAFDLARALDRLGGAAAFYEKQTERLLAS